MRSVWYWMLPLVLGCSGKHIVAGDDKTKSEQLVDSLPTWCQQICEAIVACTEGRPCDCDGDSCNCASTDVADCRESCQQEMRRYTSRGEACAVLGQSFQSCVDQLSCEEFSSSKGELCEPSSADMHCPEVGGDGPIASGGTASGPDGGASIGATGAGGASGGETGGAAPSAGGSAGNGGASGGSGPSEPVSCLGSYGLGGTGNVSATILCEEGRLQCSDDHEYGWLCARGSNSQLACSCFVDTQFTRGFDPKSESCPSLELVNEGCNFALVR
jgi:hypothetical protein